MTVDLVTGGSGFFGAMLVAHLVGLGHSVRVLDPVPPAGQACDAVDWRAGSVLDAGAVRDAVAGADVVYHTAALVPLTKAGNGFTDVNATGSGVVADAALDSGVRRFVHLSSSAVFDPRRVLMPITPATPTCPVGRYGASKHAAELEVLARVERGLHAVILRPRTIVDEGRGGIFQILFDWIARGSRVIVVGDGSEQFQLVSGSDLVDATVRCATHQVAPGTVLNAGAAEFGTFEELVDHLIEHAGTGSRMWHVPAVPARVALAALDRLRLSPLTDWHYLTLGHPFAFDISETSAVLGWTPRDSNDAMVRRAYDHYVAHEAEMLAEQGSAHRTAPRQGVLRLLRRR